MALRRINKELKECIIENNKVLYTDFYYYLDAKKYDIKIIRNIIKKLSSNKCIINNFHTFIIDNIEIKDDEYDKFLELAEKIS